MHISTVMVTHHVVGLLPTHQVCMLLYLLYLTGVQETHKLPAPLPLPRTGQQLGTGWAKHGHTST
jgi:hypothetical protein